MVPSPRSDTVSTSTSNGSKALGSSITPSNAIVIMCTITDPADIRAKYFAEDKWRGVHIFPDLHYNGADKMQRYVLICSCKDTLRDAFAHLRALRVVVEKTVNRKAWEGALQSIKKSSALREIFAETHNGLAMRPQTVEAETQGRSFQELSRALLSIFKVFSALGAQPLGLGTLENSSQSDLASEWVWTLASWTNPLKAHALRPSRDLPDSASARSLSSCRGKKSAASLLSLNTQDDYCEDEDVNVGDVCSYWEPAASAGIQMTLPQNWTISNALADREERVESPLMLATLRYERCRAAARGLSKLAATTKDAVERRQRTLELELALRSVLYARKDLGEKAAIQRFLDQYQDRPEVPEHWAADPITHKYTWTGYNQHYVNKRRRPWKSLNY
ncbi:hypothetical protein FRC00_003703 [Tulasnella sp. 408]|nr:hypothetical protein FRC00_003703 [Tulasnella sp. 408]